MAKWEPTTRPHIVCAANRIRGGHADEIVIAGPRHWDTTMRRIAKAMQFSGCDYARAEQGFIDQWGRFYTREEAMKVARQNKQIIVSDDQMLSKSALHSEDLY